MSRLLLASYSSSTQLASTYRASAKPPHIPRTSPRSDLLLDRCAVYRGISCGSPLLYCLFCFHKSMSHTHNIVVSLLAFHGIRGTGYIHVRYTRVHRPRGSSGKHNDKKVRRLWYRWFILNKLLLQKKGVGRCAFRPPRVVFVLGLVSLINSLTSGKKNGFFTAAVWCVPALRVPLVHSLINHFRKKKNLTAAGGVCPA